MKKEVFKIPQSTNAGIYMIYNTTNHRAYIGQTRNFHNRATAHKQNLLCNKHSNNELQNDFNSGHDLIFTVLENAPDSASHEDLELREKQYIFAFLDRYINLYNHESIEQLKNYLFYYMVSPAIDKIKTDFRNGFSCHIASLRRCGKETLEEKFSIQ